MESQRIVLRDAAERGALSSYEFDIWLAGIDDDPALLLIIANELVLSPTRDSVSQILDDLPYSIPGPLNDACQILTLWCDIRRTNIDPTPIRVLVDALTDRLVKRTRLPRERERRRVATERIQQAFYAAQLVLDRISNVARHQIRIPSANGSARKRCRLALHPTNGVAMLDGEPFNVKPKQYQLLAYLINANGEYASLDSVGLRSRDVEALPEKLREAVETQPGVGARIKPEIWLS